MSELPWGGTEVAEEARPEHQSEKPAAEPGTLAMSADDFAALEDRVLRAVNVVKRERLARTEAEERASVAEAVVQEQSLTIEQMKKDTDELQKEIGSLRSERDQVRQRVERLLSQLDALEV